MPHWSNWVIALDARLRKASGEAFQTFFSDFMGRVHGDSFIAVRAHGSAGDGGVDGTFGLEDTIYQCYGAVNGSVPDAAYVCRKMKADYRKARNSCPGMKKWKFAHNLVSGMPWPLVQALEEVRGTGSVDGVEVGQFGFEGFQGLLRKLDDPDRELLLGVRAMEEVDRAALPHEINGLIGLIMGWIDSPPSEPQELGEVPQDKLELNNIPPHWQMHLKSFFVHAPIAAGCLASYGNPRAAEAVPSYFKLRYLNLRDQGLAPGEILLALKETLSGRLPGRDDSSREAAVMTLLASMFESCVVFEEKRYSPAEETVHDPA